MVYYTGVEKILGWALSYQLMQNTEVSAKDSKIVVSVERLLLSQFVFCIISKLKIVLIDMFNNLMSICGSIKYGLNILQGIQSETNILKKSLKVSFFWECFSCGNGTVLVM